MYWNSILLKMNFKKISNCWEVMNLAKYLTTFRQSYLRNKKFVLNWPRGKQIPCIYIFCLSFYATNYGPSKSGHSLGKIISKFSYSISYGFEIISFALFENRPLIYDWGTRSCWHLDFARLWKFCDSENTTPLLPLGNIGNFLCQEWKSTFWFQS